MRVLALYGLFLGPAVLAVAQAPLVEPGGVVDAASFKGPVVPGSLVSIFGSNLASGTADLPKVRRSSPRSGNPDFPWVRRPAARTAFPPAPGPIRRAAVLHPTTHPRDATPARANPLHPTSLAIPRRPAHASSLESATASSHFPAP